MARAMELSSRVDRRDDSTELRRRIAARERRILQLEAAIVEARESIETAKDYIKQDLDTKHQQRATEDLFLLRVYIGRVAGYQSDIRDFSQMNERDKETLRCIEGNSAGPRS